MARREIWANGDSEIFITCNQNSRNIFMQTVKIYKKNFLGEILIASNFFSWEIGMALPVAVAIGVAAVLQKLRTTFVVRGLAYLGRKYRLFSPGAAINGVAYGAALAAPELVEYFRGVVYNWIIARFSAGWGVELDRDAPLSDKSLCGAIKSKTGLTLRTIRNKQKIGQDVERWAFAELESRTGLRVRDIRDAKKTKEDVLRFASPIVADLTGIPLSDLSDKDKVGVEVFAYLKDRALVLLAQDMSKIKKYVASALGEIGTTLDDMARLVVEKGGYDEAGVPRVRADAETVALAIVANALVKADKRRRNEALPELKVARRKEQLRMGLKRFRERHGHRMTYERVK
jgi:hypothetical protein